MGWGHQPKILGGAQDFKRGLEQRDPEGASRTESWWGWGVSKTTGRQVQWPDWELTSQAGVGKRRGMRLAPRVECRLQRS